MCTITLNRLKSGQIVLSQNRDESRTRGIAHAPQWRDDASQWLYPVDTQAHGTWMMVHRDEPRHYCLFNGAEHRHQHAPPYRHSRGQVLIDLSQKPNATEYFEQVNLTDIEPFSVLAVEREGVNLFRWDGKRISREKQDALPQIFCSSTLYTPEQQQLRHEYFERFDLAEWRDIQDFHKSRFPIYDDEGIAIKRDKVETVNLFTVLMDEDFLFQDFRYFEF